VASSQTPEKLLKIADDIAENGNVALTRLTVLKRWLDQPPRLKAFALWIAVKALSHKRKARSEAAELYCAARALLNGAVAPGFRLDPSAAKTLHDRLKRFQSEYRQQRWGPVRIVHDWDLLLVEEALAICLWHEHSPALGYKLAADYCQHYHERYGNGLNGPSAGKIKAMAHFMEMVEAKEQGVPPR